MAEIKIKKKAPVWPWIIGLLIVGLIIYFLVFADNNADDVNDDVGPAETEQVTDENVNKTAELGDIPEINNYKDYISNPDMDVNHEFSSNALSKLIIAVKATAANLDINIDADLANANNKADEIMRNPTALNHADKIKDAANDISQALKKIQKERFPDLTSEYSDVDTAVSNIKSKTPTLDQKNEIRDFFNNAGNLLTSIQNNYGQAQ